MTVLLSFWRLYLDPDSRRIAGHRFYSLGDISDFLFPRELGELVVGQQSEGRLGCLFVHPWAPNVTKGTEGHYRFSHYIGPLFRYLYRVTNRDQQPAKSGPTARLRRPAA